MPWTLNTPIPSPHGDLDAIVITSHTPNSKGEKLTIEFEVGLIDGGEFVAKKFMHHTVMNTPATLDPATREPNDDAGTDFTEMVMQPPVGATMYECIKNMLYTRLHDDGIIDDGTLT